MERVVIQKPFHTTIPWLAVALLCACAPTGGLAKVTTVLKANYTPVNTVVLSVGDLTHGSAEGLFTAGDAAIKAANAVDKAIEDYGRSGNEGAGPAYFSGRLGN